MAYQILFLQAAVLLSLVIVSEGFSRGSLLVTGSTAARRMYCNRPVLNRPPVHMEQSCNGVCEPQSGADHFTIHLHGNDTSYWINGFEITLRALQNSTYDVTGFSLVAVDEMGTIAGVFTGNDDVLVGTCENVAHNVVEGQYVVHTKAQRGRKDITVTWTPDGYNHERVKFHAWVVHNHSSIFYVESDEINSQKHGDKALDVDDIFQHLMGTALASMSEFEQTFGDRQTLGYNIELDDPFEPFNQDPSQKDLVPGFGEPKTSRGENGWLSNYNHMLSAIDRGGVFRWSDMIRPAQGRNAFDVAQLASLGDASYTSGLIGDGLKVLKELGKNNDKILRGDSNEALLSLSRQTGTVLEDDLGSNTNGTSETVQIETNSSSLSSFTETDNEVVDNATIKDTGANFTTDLSANQDDVEVLMPLNETNFVDLKPDLGPENTSITSEQNLFQDLDANVTITLNTTSKLELDRKRFEPNVESPTSVNTNLVSNVNLENINGRAGGISQDFLPALPKPQIETAVSLKPNRVRRQASEPPKRKMSPPPWAMGPNMAIPSNPGARGPPPNARGSQGFPMPNMRPNRQLPGMNSDPLGLGLGGNPLMGRPQRPQFSRQNGPQQPFGAPMGQQQFPPGMGSPQQFPGGAPQQPPMRRPNTKPFLGGPAGQMGTSMQARPNQFGPPNQNPFGQPPQNPFGQAGPNPFGQGTQNPFGQNSQNHFGQGQNPFGQGEQNPFGQGAQNPFNQGGQNSFGQNGQIPFNQGGQNSFGQGSPNPFAQDGQSPLGPTGQNPFGQPNRQNQLPFGQQNQNPFQLLNQNPFGQQAQNPFGRQGPNSFRQQPPRPPPFGTPNRDQFGPPSSFPRPGGPDGVPDGEDADIGPLPGLDGPPPLEALDAELELKPSPFEAMGGPPLGPPSSSSNSFGRSGPRPPPGGGFSMGNQNPFGHPQGMSGRPNPMMGGSPFQQQQNPFGGFQGSSSGFSGFPGQMPGMPPQNNRMGGGFPQMPSQFGQSGFGNRQGMPFVGNQFGGSSNGMSPFGTRGAGGSMSGFPGMSNPFMQSSPFGRSSRMPGMNPLASQMGNPLSSRSMNPFSSSFSSPMRGGFPGMQDMRGMQGGRPPMRPPMGAFPSRSMRSRSRPRK